MIKHLVETGFGFFLLAVTLINTLGEMLVRDWVPSCSGEHLYMFVIVQCGDQTTQSLLQYLVDFARALVEPAISLGDELYRLTQPSLSNALVKAIGTVPLSIVLLIGGSFWWQRSPVLALLIVAPLIFIIADYI